MPPVPQQVNAPPVQPRANRRGRMFETSSAMLEIFGGASTPQTSQEQRKTSQKEKDTASLNAALATTAVYEGSATIRQTEPSTSQAAPMDIDHQQNAQVQSASVTFQQIPPTPPTANANDRPQFGRTNALNREGVSRTEWEPINTQTTATVSSFQVCHLIPFCFCLHIFVCF